MSTLHEMLRFVFCGHCMWVGRMGEVIASDRLRCPNCHGDDVAYVTAPGTPTLQ